MSLIGFPLFLCLYRGRRHQGRLHPRDFLESDFEKDLPQPDHHRHFRRFASLGSPSDSRSLSGEWLDGPHRLAFSDSDGSNIKYVPFWRFDVTLPWIHQTAVTLGGLSSPLVWLAIGCTLGAVSFKQAASDRYAWIYSGLKVFLAPAIVLGILYGVEAIAIACNYRELVSIYTVESAVLMWMVPPATVAVAYCINFDKEKVMASDISLIATFVAIPESSSGC
jgi:hypothetical protein